MRTRLEDYETMPMSRKAIAAVLPLSPVLLLAGCLIMDGSFRSKELHSFSFRSEDNEGLRKDYVGKIDRDAKIVAISIPDYVDASRLAARIVHGAAVARLDGGERETGGLIAADYRSTRKLSLSSYDDETDVYSIVPTRVPPDAAANVELFRLCGSRSPYAGDRRVWTLAEGTVLDASNGSCRVDIDYGFGLDPTRLFLDFRTNAIKLTASGRTLQIPKDGEGSWYEIREDSPNWLDFSAPVDMVATAEDLSEHRYALTVAIKTSLSRLVLPAADNPSLKRDYLAAIDQTGKKATIVLPAFPGLDPSRLRARAEYKGKGIRIGPLASEEEIGLDLTVASSLTVAGDSRDQETSYALALETRPLSSRKALGSIRIGTLSRYPVAENELAWECFKDSISCEFPSSVDLAALYVEPLIDGAAVYVKETGALLHVRTDGEKNVKRQGNFVDFTRPVTLVVEAEDGSSVEYATNIRNAAPR